MKKHKVLSLLLSSIMAIAGIAVPLPQKADISVGEKMTAYAEGDYYTTKDGLRFRYDSIKKTAAFTGYFGYEEELVVPSTVTVMIADTYPLECTVTDFDVYGFLGDEDKGHIEQLTKVTIPGTIKELKIFAFQDMYTGGWMSLKEIVIEEGVETIEAFAFRGCKYLETITIPSTVKDIDDNAFTRSFGDFRGVILGYSGTVTEKFAKYKNYTFVSLGEPPSAETTTTAPVTTEPPVTTTTTAVVPDIPDLELEETEVTLEEGEQYTIVANQENLTYKSNNTDVAVVSKKGVVTAMGEGTAVISVVNGDGDVVQLKVTVVPVGQNITAGDCNNDGEFNIADVVYLEQWLLNKPNIKLNNWKAADLCEDGRLDVFDLVMMRRKLING